MTINETPLSWLISLLALLTTGIRLLAVAAQSGLEITLRIKKGAPRNRK
jgi:hypothetical protein